jgi:hypothetical protein
MSQDYKYTESGYPEALHLNESLSSVMDKLEKRCIDFGYVSLGFSNLGLLCAREYKPREDAQPPTFLVLDLGLKNTSWLIFGIEAIQRGENVFVISRSYFDISLDNYGGLLMYGGIAVRDAVNRNPNILKSNQKLTIGKVRNEAQKLIEQ